ncbi:VC0807 family protein [Catenulispora rubra]|uniref:VC0807 family protein n=1 Tax=Catenulispora rubra TaxID=280293 RepID=UPI001E3841F5|nr:VC0807 family protein [Catenulispora rubra]
MTIATASTVTASTVTTSAVTASTAISTENTAAMTSAEQAHPLKQTLAPLAIDIAVPLGGYYVLHSALGLGTAAALGLSSVVPAARSIWAAAVRREANALALLMLTVNVVAIALTFVSGNARLMLAKDSAVSSTIALGILWSVRGGKPMMTAGLKPFVTKGDAARTAAWDVLRAESAKFRAKENLFSVIWGGWLLAECAARLVGAFVLPVSTMAWLGTVVLVVAIAGACVTGGAAVEPLEKLIAAHVEAHAETVSAEER